MEVANEALQAPIVHGSHCTHRPRRSLAELGIAFGYDVTTPRSRFCLYSSS